MGVRTGEPIGLQLAQTTKVVRRAFDEALTQAGGSLPIWLVMVALKNHHHGTQRDLAEVMEIEGPTLTHHLNRMERAGLLMRTRDPQNRRVHQVTLTAAGEALFEQLLGAVTAFDRRLRRGLGKTDLDTLGAVLDQLRLNVSG